MNDQVEHFFGQSRFEIIVEGRKAYLEYELRDNRMNILHTFVPSELEGRGLGSALMKEALRYASETGLEVVPVCSFAVSYMKRLQQGGR